MNPRMLTALVFGAALTLPATAGTANTNFTYQGKLIEAGAPANGEYDMIFAVYDAAEAGNFLGLQNLCGANKVTVSNGLFTAAPDLGAIPFGNGPLWLEVRVRHATGACGGGMGQAPMTILTPRTPLTGTPFALQTRGIHVDDDGQIGVGTTAPDADLDVAGTLDVEHLDVDGFASFDQTSFAEQAILNGGARIQNSTLIVDGPNNTGPTTHTVSIYATNQGNALRVVNDGSGVAGRFAGGDVVITNGNVGIGATNPAQPLHVDGGSDASVSNPSSGFLMMGNSGNTNIVMDSNEIMARNGGFPSTLYLNHEGGNVQLGGGLVVSGNASVGGDLNIGGRVDIGLEIVESSSCNEYANGCWIELSCSAGKRLIGGGCSAISASDDITDSYPVSATRWRCHKNADCDPCIRAYAICANVE